MSFAMKLSHRLLTIAACVIAPPPKNKSTKVSPLGMAFTTCQAMSDFEPIHGMPQLFVPFPQSSLKSSVCILSSMS